MCRLLVLSFCVLAVSAQWGQDENNNGRLPHRGQDGIWYPVSLPLKEMNGRALERRRPVARLAQLIASNVKSLPTESRTRPVNRNDTEPERGPANQQGDQGMEDAITKMIMGQLLGGGMGMGGPQGNPMMRMMGAENPMMKMMGAMGGMGGMGGPPHPMAAMMGGHPPMMGMMGGGKDMKKMMMKKMEKMCSEEKMEIKKWLAKLPKSFEEFSCHKRCFDQAGCDVKFARPNYQDNQAKQQCARKVGSCMDCYGKCKKDFMAPKSYEERKKALWKALMSGYTSLEDFKQNMWRNMTNTFVAEHCYGCDIKGTKSKCVWETTQRLFTPDATPEPWDMLCGAVDCIQQSLLQDQSCQPMREVIQFEGDKKKEKCAKMMQMKSMLGLDIEDIEMLGLMGGMMDGDEYE